MDYCHQYIVVIIYPFVVWAFCIFVGFFFFFFGYTVTFVGL